MRAEIEERIIDFLEINHIRHQPVASLPTGCASASNSPARSP